MRLYSFQRQFAYVSVLVSLLLCACRHSNNKDRPASSAAYLAALKKERIAAGQDSSAVKEKVWYKNSCIYTLDIKMFKDSDGDGIGDIKGLISQLDYLQWLGADILWLPPFFPSPLQDDGYDISNFYAVDPRLGSMDDFKTLVQSVKSRGMHIIIDLVLNHTSNQHPWFQQAKQSASTYHNWYLWSKKKPANENAGMVFLGYQDGIWQYDSGAGQYYYHRFYNFEPDLNTQYPAVKNEMDKVMRFWLSTGIDGFRVDAVTYLTEKANAEKKDAEFEHDYSLLQHIRQVANSASPANIVLGEASVMVDKTEDFFGKHGEALSMIFNFYADQRIFYAMATEDISKLRETLEASAHTPLQSAWVYFLRNQDEMGMGKLSAKEKQKVFEAFAPEEFMQLYKRGIRRRLAPMLNNQQQRLRMAYSFLFSLQGVPMLRYGDELGMGDNLTLTERLAVRTPMQWNDSNSSAGFSANSKTLRPVITDSVFSYHRINVAAAMNDNHSLLHYIRSFIQLRKKYPGIAYGRQQFIDAGAASVLAVKYSWNGSQIFILHNFSGHAATATLNATEIELPLQSILPSQPTITVKNGKYNIILEPYGYRWLIIKQQ